VWRMEGVATKLFGAHSKIVFRCSTSLDFPVARAAIRPTFSLRMDLCGESRRVAIEENIRQRRIRADFFETFPVRTLP